MSYVVQTQAIKFIYKKPILNHGRSGRKEMRPEGLRQCSGRHLQQLPNANLQQAFKEIGPIFPVHQLLQFH